MGFAVVVTDIFAIQPDCMYMLMVRNVSLSVLPYDIKKEAVSYHYQ